MKNFKKLFACILFVVCIPCILQFPIMAKAEGRAEIAMDLDTQSVLYENGSNMRLPMASTTKIMTAILAINDLDLKEVVVVPDEAVGIEGSSVYLKRGQSLTIEDLLYGLMLRSGNDCATALAILHSGSVCAFVQAMNQKAKEIGCLNTNFKNPSGLPDPNHYTTAFDLCKIACYAMKNQTFSKIVSTKFYDSERCHFVNKNKMLTTFEGANGVKTGYTTKAGRCLVSSAKRGDMDVICVVLDCYDMYERSKEILSDCFSRFEYAYLSPSQVFSYQGKLFSSKEENKFIVKKDSVISYQIEPLSDDELNNDATNSKIQAKLNIFSQNNLIFTQNLYNIDTVQK